MEPGGLVRPVPTWLGAGVAPDPENPGQQYVVVRVESVNGSFTFPLDPESAAGFGAQLVTLGKQAKTGLIVAGSMPPDVNGHPV